MIGEVTCVRCGGHLELDRIPVRDEDGLVCELCIESDEPRPGPLRLVGGTDFARGESMPVETDVFMSERKQ